MDSVMLFFVVLVGSIEILSIWWVNRRLRYEHDFMVERGTAGEQFGGWLLGGNLDDKGVVIENAPTNLEFLTDQIANRLFQSQKFSAMQEASVDSRIANKYDAKIVEGLQKKMPIGWKFIIKAAEYLGFDIEEIMEKGELQQFLNALQRNEVGALMGSEPMQANPGKSRFGMK